MKIGFEFLRQWLELLTSDLQDYLNNEIEKFKELSRVDINDCFLKERGCETVAYIIYSIKKHEYPLYICRFLLTNIHILELDYLNHNTVVAVKKMLRNNFKYIYDLKVYIIANYDEELTNDAPSQQSYEVSIQKALTVFVEMLYKKVCLNLDFLHNHIISAHRHVYLLCS